jgi:hypothetical protein
MDAGSTEAGAPAASVASLGATTFTEAAPSTAATSSNEAATPAEVPMPADATAFARAARSAEAAPTPEAGRPRKLRQSPRHRCRRSTGQDPVRDHPPTALSGGPRTVCRRPAQRRRLRMVPIDRRRMPGARRRTSTHRHPGVMAPRMRSRPGISKDSPAAMPPTASDHAQRSDARRPRRPPHQRRRDPRGGPPAWRRLRPAPLRSSSASLVAAANRADAPGPDSRVQCLGSSDGAGGCRAGARGGRPRRLAWRPRARPANCRNRGRGGSGDAGRGQWDDRRGGALDSGNAARGSAAPCASNGNDHHRTHCRHRGRWPAGWPRHCSDACCGSGRCRGRCQGNDPRRQPR